MWIVRLALLRPYTFVVMALLIALLGAGAIKKTPTDIFPEIDIPVVSVIWTYNGLSAEEMERRITVYSEFAISVTEVKKDELHARRLGVEGVPFFVLDQKVGLSGAQEPATFLEAFEEAGFAGAPGAVCEVRPGEPPPC